MEKCVNVYTKTQEFCEIEALKTLEKCENR